MSVYEGVYKSFLQGVSQQTPQERTDGQLGEQINMLSDPVTGLRRRGGVKFVKNLAETPAGAYIEIVEFSGVPYTVTICTVTGTVRVYSSFATGTTLLSTTQNDYFKASSKKVLRTTVAREKYYVVNTEKVPTKQNLTTNTRKNPDKFGYFSIRGSEFSKTFSVDIKYGDFSITNSQTASSDTAAQASPEHIANKFLNGLNGTPSVTDIFNVTLSGTTIALEVKDKTSTGSLNIESSTTGGYLMTSGTSRVSSKSELLGTLPIALDGYTVAVGSTGNSAYYQYNDSTKQWAEVGVYEVPYKVINEPMYLHINEAGTPELKTLGIKSRSAGDDDNNPLPKFIGYGITGISSYQSRLVILNGSYVNLSKTTDYSEYMRTSVTELLDDDPIEIASAASSSAQYEYAIPYNKDLVLIAQGQQAVIPANATVLTPKTAVIYPSTKIDLSLAVQPVVVARTMYYTYQRGEEYYQVGEFIPNTYTEAQYYSQNITDHIPLYAEGVCTSMAASSTNNMVVMSSDGYSVLVNQYMWQGDDRPLMSFHKWVFNRKVVHVQFLEEFLVLYMDNGEGKVVVGTLNVQLNQLDDKPIPYLDFYNYIDVVDGTATLPNDIVPVTSFEDMVASIYDSRTQRHKEVQFEVTGSTFNCPYTGRVAFGEAYSSTFTLTPPFIKDDSGKVIAGTRSTIQQLRMTFKNTGSFDVSVKDTMGTAYIGEGNTALTWSEADLGYSWINSIGAVTIPCRTRLASTECTVQTEGTTDMNLVSTEYVLRIAQKRRRL